MKLKSFFSIFLGMSLAFSAISCSDVHFSNAPSAECAAADNCLADPSGETMTKIIDVPYANKKVDLLFVIDNSRTMIEEQAAITGRLADFLNRLNSKGIDWRIGITTTDTKPVSGTNIYNPQDYRNGKLVPFLTSSSATSYAVDSSGQKIYYISKDTPNYSSLFDNTIKRPESTWCAISTNQSVCPSVITGDERGIVSASNNLNASFIRSDAQLHIVIISDEDERSNGGGFPGYGFETIDSPDNLKAQLSLMNKKTRVHSIVQLPANFNYNNFDYNGCVNSQVSDNAHQEYIGCNYIKASILTSGIVGNKNGNYTDILSAIANDIENTSVSRQDFSCVPTTIEVKPVDGKPYPANFSKPSQTLSSYGNKYVDFSPALPEGTSISITWTCPRQ